MGKKCVKCGVVKTKESFSKLSRASDGLNYRCKECCSEYYKSIYPNFRDKKLKKAKIRYKTKRCEILKQQKSKYDAEKKKDYNKKYNELNKLIINKRKNEYENKRIVNDPNYRLIKNMRKIVYRSLNNKKDSTFSILGYNSETLIKWLGRPLEMDESIDHKIPVSWFKPNSPIHVISHYKNLQILTKSENSKKSNTYADCVDLEFFKIAINHIKDKYKSKVYYGEQ